MKTKLLFLLVFVPVHALLSLNALHYAFNPPSGGALGSFQALGADDHLASPSSVGDVRSGRREAARVDSVRFRSPE